MASYILVTISFLDDEMDYCVQKLARKCRTEVEALPKPLKDNEIAKTVLKASKHMNVEDPLLVILWDDRGFNDVPGAAGMRNGITGQTRDVLVNHIVARGGTDIWNMHTAFLFVLWVRFYSNS
ncbi:hypothetical protein BC936DRAFT_143943 [Jimgerdemannia flammicorona]|uniref:Uncharacterized protein n=1 Tax=Jimgerdemannia flammicorona TaxID=994334 RepID=A0A432ZYS7_9FUNG|nr:hypothetical protein BC936DRAFT_143943 [Jimgerdemannia flammicorona]